MKGQPLAPKCSGVLYLVATPIGNLGDITLRALEVLRQVPLIAAEDTRKTRRLLARHQIKARLTSYHEQNSLSKLPMLLQHLREHDLALVSEAGTPGLSDPGFELVAAAIEQGIKVIPIPGPSALTAALVASGLPTHQFTYLGFLPRKKGERRRLLESLREEPRTLVAFEAPHRLLSALEEIHQVMGNRRIAVCRELTKLHEEIFRGTVREALARFQEPRGEFTLVIEGKMSPRGEDAEAGLAEELAALRWEGLSAKEAVARVSRGRGLPRNLVYRAWVEAGRKA